MAITNPVRDLYNLLALIHRDGGQHTDNVGLKQSVLDANHRIVELNVLSDLIATRPHLRGTLYETQN